MPKYEVKFEFFGRRMSMKVAAANEAQAQECVKVRLNFHSVTQLPAASVADIIDDDPAFRDLMDQLGYKPK